MSRWPALLVAGLVAIACSTQPMPSPSPAASLRPTPDPSTLPSPVPTVSLPPAGPACDELGLVVTPEFDPAIVDAGFDERWASPSVGFAVTRVTDRADPSTVWTGSPSDSAVERPGWLPGGTTVSIRMGDDEDSGYPPIEVIDSMATLRLDGSEPEFVPTTFDVGADGWSRIFLQLPDVQGSGVVEIDAVWEDRCLRYEGSARLVAALETNAVVQACPPSSDEGGVSYVEDLLQPPITVGGTEIAPEFSGVEWIWKPGAFSTDFFSLFPAWDRRRDAIHGSPGSSIRVRPGNPNLQITGFRTDFFAPGDAVAELEHGDPAKPVVRRDPEMRDDGTVELQLPDSRGRYVTFTVIEWTSSCLMGSLIANFSVDVE